MLLFLSPSLVKYSANGPVPPGVVEAINILAIGFREGRHVVVGAVGTINAMLRISDIEPRTRAVLRSIKEQFPQLMALPSRYSRLVNIIADDEGSMSTRMNGNQLVIDIPISHFTDTSKIQSTIVLAEHAVDAKLALLMAKYYRSKIQLTAIPINADPHLGGGSNMPSVLESIETKRERFCAAIVDSDRKCEAGKLRDTARKVQEKHREVNSAIAEVFTLRCKEMENVLPDALYHDLYWLNPAHKDDSAFLKALSENGEFEARDFIDIKEGLSLRDVFSYTVGSPEHTFWTSRLQLLKKLSPRSATHSTFCESSEVCQSTSTCSCWFLHPNNSNILEAALNVLSKWGPADWKRFSKRTAAHWAEIGQFIFEWCSGWKFSAS